MLKRLLTACFLALMVGAAMAGPVEGDWDAFFAYTQGNYATTLKLWRPLAEQGDVSAQSFLGRMYDEGKGVPQNYAEAMKWYRLAAERGGSGAQYGLGGMYHHGHGVPQNYILAHLWYNLASARGVTIAEEERDIIAKRMTPDQIAEAQRLAAEWKPKRP